MTNIIIITRNRFNLISQTIASLYCHTETNQFNLVIVDDGSDDFRCKRGLRGINRANCSLLEVSNSGHTLSQLKNLGVAWAEQRWGRGDWLYLSDGDVWFSEGWLEKLLEVTGRKCFWNFTLFGGQIHPFHKPLPGSENWDVTEHSILDGPSWLMRWSTWDQYGPLDRTTAPGVCQSEEYPFCQRLIAGGSRIGVISPHVVVHTGLTHLDGTDCVGRTEREAMIPKGVIAE